MFKNTTKPETKVTKKEGEHTEVSMKRNIFEHTQNVLMCNNSDEFKRNYMLAFKAISENIDLVKIREAIEGNGADSIAIRTIYQKSKDLFEYYISQDLNIMVSSVISMTYDFVVNKMEFNEKQLDMFRAKFYSKDILMFNQYGPNARYANCLFNDMLNQINRRILMVVETDDKNLSVEEKNFDEINSFMSSVGFESIMMNYATSFALELYDYIFTNLISIAAFDTETMSEGKYPMLLNFVDDFLNDVCAEIKKMYIESMYTAMYPYLMNHEFAMMLGLISNAMTGGYSYRHGIVGNTINVYPEPEEVSKTNPYQYRPKDSGYNF